MSAFIAALVYAWISHGAALVLMPLSIAFNYLLRVLVTWGFAALALFTIQDWMAAMAVVAFAAVLLAPHEAPKRAAFFVSIVPCLPVYMVAPLPFPGLNYLLEASHYKLLSVCLLLPLFFVRRRSDELALASRTDHSKVAKVLDLCVLAYVIYTAIIVANAVNLTSSLRYAVDQSLNLALPYFALRYAIQTMDDVEVVLEGFLVASIMLALVCLVSTAKQWDFYWLLNNNSIMNVYDNRAGFLRIHGPASTHSLGYHLAVGVVILYYLRQRLRLIWIQYRVLQVALLGGMFFTNSHGAIAGLAVAWASYAVIRLKNNFLRICMLFIFVNVVIMGGAWLLVGNAGTADVYGSIGYRQLLFQIGSAYVLENPIFGHYNFYSNPVFEPLRQGQGIIDITNLYLQILLHYGFVGGVLFFSIMMVPLAAIVRLSFRISSIITAKARELGQGRTSASSPSLDRQKSIEQDVLKWRKFAAIAFGAQMGWLFLVGTTSDVGLTIHLGVFCAVLCRIAWRFGRHTVASIAEPPAHRVELHEPAVFQR
jgi:hypothetical protein